MSATATTDISLEDPMGSEQEPWQGDLLLPSLFISVAALILVVQNPVHLGYQPRLVETLVLTAGGVALLGWGTFRNKLPPVLWGAGALLVVIALGLGTQPPQLGVGTAPVWPLRTGLVLLVAGAWAFLMRPPLWVRRAVVAFLIPTTLGLVCVGGPAFAGQLLGRPQFYPNPYVSPYWVAVDSRGTLYASDAQGGAVYVFDASGMPRGSLNPTAVPAIGTPGPGIVPIGLVAPLSLPGTSVIPTATPFTTTITADLQPIFTYCGLAVDPHDNLYLMDLVDPTNRSILRFDRDGNVTARWPAPTTFEPTRGCIAADANHVYLSSLYGQIYAFDGNGKVTRELKVDFQPFGIAAAGEGNLMVMGPTVLNQLNLDTGEAISMTLPSPTGQLQIPYQAMAVTRNGHILATDLANNRVLRLDPAAGQVVGQFGEAGLGPGQFSGLGGVAEDSSGHIYVADWLHRAIKRFTPDGQIEALWQVKIPGGPQVVLEEEGE